MVAEHVVMFDELTGADLVLDRVYRGGDRGHAGDDPIAKLVPVGNQGGFRYKGSVVGGTVRLVVLYTSGAEIDWPDQIDPSTGDFTYYGDNRRPGHELHNTSRRGNQLLRDMFSASRGGSEMRRTVPPTLLFQRVDESRAVIFRGLLAPGSPRLSAEEELVAVWRTTQDRRFQNYRGHFTILRTPVVTRRWIDEIVAGDPLGAECPNEWKAWVQGRIFQPLEAPRTVAIRSKAEQMPAPHDMWILRQVHGHFAPDPIAFESFAAHVWLRSDPHVSSVEVTRPSRDGGRDAVGEYLIGPASDPVRLQFALEAKCFDPEGGGVSVRMVSRLIARIKHREFGVLVTTAHVGAQPYAEVREDLHPVIFFTGRDIVEVLKRQGLATPARLADFLASEFPVEGAMRPEPNVERADFMHADLESPNLTIQSAEGFADSAG